MLFAPDGAADGREGVGEGRHPLGAPGRRCGEAAFAGVRASLRRVVSFGGDRRGQERERPDAPRPRNGGEQHRAESGAKGVAIAAERAGRSGMAVSPGENTG